jgi:hypothetical protein
MGFANKVATGSAFGSCKIFHLDACSRQQENGNALDCCRFPPSQVKHSQGIFSGFLPERMGCGARYCFSGTGDHEFSP